MTLHNNLFHLVHTNAASVLHSITPGTQGPTHPLGRQSKHESCMMKCPFGFESAKTISPILNSPRLLFSTNNIRKKDEIPCHHPPLKIKVLQTTKISKLGLLSLSLTKSKLHSHLITLALFPKQVQEAHDPGLFQSR